MGRRRSGVGKRGDLLECENPESEAMPLDMDIFFILCLWFMHVHSTKYYRTLMPQYIHFEQNAVFSTSAGSLEYMNVAVVDPAERIGAGRWDVAGRPTRKPDDSG